MKTLMMTLFSISLKTRILREWQKANRAQDQEFSERELLTLELISDFGPITEKGLCKIFGISFSSVGDIVKKLTQANLVEADRGRGQPLELTKHGKQRLEQIKEVSAVRFGYLLEGLTEKEQEAFLGIMAKVDKNAEQYVQRLVFDRYTAK
ncbi:MAG: hypothetical protein KIS67_08190 [Verrucomicrobiae bacterium]|nr:hypothetical protein [Verrucomicrobiae bacterium]